MGITQQHRTDGSLRHLLTLEGLSRTELEMLLERSHGHSLRFGLLALHPGQCLLAQRVELDLWE